MFLKKDKTTSIRTCEHTYEQMRLVFVSPQVVIDTFIRLSQLVGYKDALLILENEILKAKTEQNKK